MMWWSVWFLVSSALSVDSYTARDYKERLVHGRQLKIYLPNYVEKLEFQPANEPGNIQLLWSSGQHIGSSGRSRRGHVSGTGSDRRWYLDHVTFEDEGTYTQKDLWNNEKSVLRVVVVAKNHIIDRVPGMDLTIPLEGLTQTDAQLTFMGDHENVSLVVDGSPVGRQHPDFYRRVKAYSSKIVIDSVNITDIGIYTLRDRRGRVVSVTTLELVDKLDTWEGNPLMALLLLLGIPAGICCCCRKKIFKKKGTTTATTCQPSTPETVHTPPPGPPPGYNVPPGGVAPGPGAGYPNPGMPGPQWNGPPQTNPGYAPQNPMYPPVMAPGQPQWSGPPPAQYPGGGAPMY